LKKISIRTLGEGPDQKKDVKKECNINCFDFFFFSVFLMSIMGRKITINLIELH